jgi:hypothetical protein
MTKDEALKLALEALDTAAHGLYKATPHFDTHKMIEQVEAAITAIKQALAAPVQEPVVLRPEDVHIETYSVRRGGFSIKPDNGVRLIHKPTGTVVRCNSERSQHRNREVAWSELERLLTTPPTALVQEHQINQLEKFKDHVLANADALGVVLDAPAQPAPVQDLPFGFSGGLVAIKTLLSRDPCAHANVAIEMIDEILTTPPAAQRQWVGLTDKEAKTFWAFEWKGDRVAFIRAIEAKLKEKNA